MENWHQSSWKNSFSFPKTHNKAKLPITNPPKVWVYYFPSVNRDRKWALVIMKKIALALQKLVLEPNFQLLTSKSGSKERENWHWSLWKNGSSSPKMSVRQDFFTTPQILALQFSECQWKQKIGICYYEKNGSSSPKYILEQNIILPTTPKVWFCVFSGC